MKITKVTGEFGVDITDQSQDKDRNDHSFDWGRNWDFDRADRLEDPSYHTQFYDYMPRRGNDSFGASFEIIMIQTHIMVGIEMGILMAYTGICVDMGVRTVMMTEAMISG